MALVTKSEFAKLLGRHKAYATRLGQNGRLVMVDGLVDVEASRALIAATADPSRAEVMAARDARKGVAPLPPIDAPQLAVGILHADVQHGTRAHYQRLALQFDNNLTKHMLQLKRGARFWRDAARREPRSVGEMPRAGIERMIDQLHARMTVARDEEQRRALFAAEVIRIKRAVKKEAVRAMRRMSKAGAEKSA